MFIISLIQFLMLKVRLTHLTNITRLPHASFVDVSTSITPAQSQVHTPHWVVSTCHICHEVFIDILLTILTSWPHLSCVNNVNDFIYHAKSLVHTPHCDISTWRISYEGSLEILLTILTGLLHSSCVEEVSSFISPVQKSGSHTSLRCALML